MRNLTIRPPNDTESKLPSEQGSFPVFSYEALIGATQASIRCKSHLAPQSTGTPSRVNGADFPLEYTLAQAYQFPELGSNPLLLYE